MWLIWYANMTYQSKKCVSEAHKRDLVVDYAFVIFMKYEGRNV